MLSQDLRMRLNSTIQWCLTSTHSANANMVPWSHSNGVDTGLRSTDRTSTSMSKIQTKKTALHIISTLIAPQSTESSFSCRNLSLDTIGLLIGQSAGTKNTDKSGAAATPFGTDKERA